MYQKLPIGTHQPGLILLMLDQSGSMSDPYTEGQSKTQFAADAVNRCIFELVKSCQVGERIKDRCHVAVIGYSGNQGAKIILGGRVSEMEALRKGGKRVKRTLSDGAGGLIEVEMNLPVWIEPMADGGTPMAEAFREAAQLAQLWVQENPHNFPPIVINITDGEPNDMGQAEEAAQLLQNLQTADGHLLLLNAHIASNGGQEMRLPDAEPVASSNFARFIFRISSALPQPLRVAAQNAGFAPSQAARGCVFNAGAETLTKLIVFGSTPMAGGAR